MDAVQRHFNNVDDQDSTRICRAGDDNCGGSASTAHRPNRTGLPEIRVGTSRNIVEEIASDEIASILKPAVSKSPDRAQLGCGQV
jgi:hypothetical protein